jgi:RNA polymerase sigma-70 factor (ECF subfamily)
MDERIAVACLKRGDISGLEYLVRAHQVKAIRTVYLIVGDRPLAEDIVQNAFLRAYERIAQFDASRPFGPWFLKSAVNDALKAVNGRKRCTALDEPEGEGEDSNWPLHLVDASPDPLERVETEEQSRALIEALEALPPAQRASLVLRYYLDFNETEMVEKLARPRGTVKWLLHTARERLRGLLEKKAGLK